MKKIKYFALMMAIAFTSAIGFTACSSSDETAADVNPTYDGTSVRTDFAFSVAGGPMGTTRMSGDVVQQSGKFNGMKEMFLFPFNGVPASNKATNSAFYYLGALGNSEITSSQSSKVYALQIPVGTNNFLFYGKAKNEETDVQKGKLISNITEETASAVKNTDDITFSLSPIQSGGLGDDATNLAEYMNKIAQAKYEKAATETSEAVTINWYDAPTKADGDGHYSSLKTMYQKFTGIDTNESRAGSAEGILRTVLDLYVTAKAIVAQAGGSDDVKNVANAICSAITTGTEKIAVTITETTKTIGEGESAQTVPDPQNWTASWTTGKAPADVTFPKTTLKLPMGAAQLSYNGNTHEFTYKDGPWYETHNTETSVTSTGVNVARICYPSELMYFDNSPLRATDVYKQTTDYPKTVTDWDDTSEGKEFNSWKDTEVKTSTRAVAMSNNVNYGVAMLETTVKFGEGVTLLEDNRKGITGEDNQVDIPVSNGFKVTGIIIGGQPAKVGWDMTNPGLKTGTDTDTEREKFNNVIYDQDMPESYATTAISTSASASNYTLVLDNYTSASTQKPVRFALELVNNSGKDFYGRYNMIPNGHTFYLCGELNPSGTWTKATRGTSNYRVTNEGVGRVFVQDYVTKANITISADALKKAYNTIPDLRATEVLFGLSVDLKWESGMTFNVEM